MIQDIIIRKASTQRAAKCGQRKIRRVRLASELWSLQRCCWFDRVGVAQLTEPAGFTHGGFHVEFCNSRKPSDARGRSCPAAALEGEAVRRSVETRSATSGIEHPLKAIAGVT